MRRSSHGQKGQRRPDGDSQHTTPERMVGQSEQTRSRDNSQLDGQTTPEKNNDWNDRALAGASGMVKQPNDDSMTKQQLERDATTNGQRTDDGQQ